MPSETETAARVQAVLDIPLHRFLEVELRDPDAGRAVAFLRAEATVDGRVVAAAQVTKTLVRRT